VTVKRYFVPNCYTDQHMYKHRLLLQTLLSATIHKQEEMFML